MTLTRRACLMLSAAIPMPVTSNAVLGVKVPVMPVDRVPPRQGVERHGLLKEGETWSSRFQVTLIC